MQSCSKSEPSLHLSQFRVSGVTQGVARHKQSKRSSLIPSTEAFADQESYSPIQILVKTKKLFKSESVLSFLLSGQYHVWIALESVSVKSRSPNNVFEKE